MNDANTESSRKATWRDHQQLNFWLWACLHDGEAYLRSDGEFWGFLRDGPPRFDFNEARISMQNVVELEKYHFMTSLDSLVRTLGRARSLFPAIETVCREAKHILGEGKALRDMIEHADENQEGGGRHSDKFVREAPGVAESVPGDRPGTADATSTIIDEQGHWLGGRFNVEQALVEIRAIQEEVAKLPPPTG
jgi:hypothetical protein